MRELAKVNMHTPIYAIIHYPQNDENIWTTSYAFGDKKDLHFISHVIFALTCHLNPWEKVLFCWNIT